MKTSCMTVALLSVAAALATATTDAANCDFGAIQSKLFPNATEGLKKCAAESGVDIWAISEFPTEKQAQAVMTSRTCVDYLNQINERANQQIQCDLVIQDTTKGFGALITDLLTGQTGNQTESDSGSNNIEIPDEDNAKVKAPLLDGSSSSLIAKSTTTTTPKPTTATPATTKSAATSASLSAVTAGVIAVIGFALQWATLTSDRARRRLPDVRRGVRISVPQPGTSRTPDQPATQDAAAPVRLRVLAFPERPALALFALAEVALRHVVGLLAMFLREALLHERGRVYADVFGHDVAAQWACVLDARAVRFDRLHHAQHAREVVLRRALDVIVDVVLFPFIHFSSKYL